MLYKSWWKVTGVVLLMYTIFAGLLLPLKPGVLDVTPFSARTGDTVRLEITGYNSFYQKGEDSMRIWLKMDEEHAIQAKEISVWDERRMEAVFDLPAYLPVAKRVQDFSLVIDNKVDGAVSLPRALFVTQDSIDPSMGAKSWANQSIEALHPDNGIHFPFRNILAETIRNQYFHVPLWFAMIFIFIGSVVYSIRYLRGGSLDADQRALALTRVGVLFGFLGVLTGGIWANYAWGAFWSWDVKQNMTAVALLIYLAYFVLRSAFDDPEKQARIAAVYNIFAFVALIPLIYVIPRLTDSLHPGAGGNPAFGGDDLDNTMRMVFYPAIIGWTLLGYWISSLAYRYIRLQFRWLSRD